MSTLPFDPTRPRAPVAPPADLPTAAQHARFADDGQDALADALKATRLADAFRTGRLSDAQARRVLSRIIQVGHADVGAIARRLVDGLQSGLATLGGWFRSMVAAIVPAHYAGSMAVLKTTQPAPADMAAIRSMADRQVGFLARFRRNLGSGLQPLDGTAVSRSGMYAAASWSVAMDVERERMRRDGYTLERRIRATGDSCRTCFEEAAKGFQPIGTLRSIGDSLCLTRCRCHIIYRHIVESSAEYSVT